MTALRSFWGWGVEDGGLDATARDGLKMMVGMRLGGASFTEISPPRFEDVRLPTPRIAPPSSLAAIVSQEARDRAVHTYGRAYRDIARALAGDFAAAPDAVAHPRTEAEVEAVLAWCDAQGIAAIPYGGGSSCVGGVEARGLGDRGAVSIDLGGLDRVVEVDRASRAARIEAGIYGPALERELRAHGLTLRHYPQSFEFSTLGGWIATRSGGHFATLHTHIDDFVEAVRVITPRGLVATRRLPASGAGPAPERLFLGSEGSLGIITEAWMRLQDRPRFRASVTVRFADFLRAAEAARILAQSGLWPQNCRLLDADEALNNGVGDGTRHLLLVGFESADHPLDPWMDRALAICRELGGEFKEGAGRSREGDDGDHDGAAGAWRNMFLRGPYLRDALTTLGLVAETFETAVTWDRFAAFHASVKEATLAAARRVAGAAVVSCRLTHVYPDGAAPYYTVIAPGRAGSLVSMWDEIKFAASEAILASGGTITHHHAVGRDHRPFYDRERPDLFAAALRGVKAELDPKGIMNPGVLV
ncbi:Alkyldihydroxyacetonephosphate synthase [Minicystis rosea]|nr:Alkyldihydroxyacetonephosphate synthase [Minicystis rosea]